MTESIVKPKRPTGPGWTPEARWVCHAAACRVGYPVEAWTHNSGLFVLSAVEVVDEPGKAPLGPEYHLSMSHFGNRCSAADAMWVLGQFDLADAKEDNHVPSGKVRNFWRPVADRLSGYECPCVDDEPAVREDKGDFVWRGVTR